MTKTITDKNSKYVKQPPKLSLPPKTTAEEDITKSGQRRISLMWELTQALIAVMITSAIIYNSINKVESDVLTNAFFLIVSMYFVRTNHQMVGGVSKYMGR